MLKKKLLLKLKLINNIFFKYINCYFAIYAKVKLNNKQKDQRLNEGNE